MKTDRGVRRLALLSAALALAPGGCDRAWRAYRAIELGKALPAAADLPQGVARNHLGLGCGESEFRLLPFRFRLIGAQAGLDEAGNVAAKTYVKTEMAHWLLFFATECQFVMELEVPPEAFRDTPRFEGGLWERAREALLRATTPLAAAPEPDEPPASAPAPTGEQARAARRRRMGKILAHASALASRQAPEPSSATKPAEPGDGVADVPSYAAAVRLADGELPIGDPAPGGKSDEPRELGAFAQAAMLSAMTAATDAFAGITREGYDYRRGGLGSSLRVRHLGGRRVRIEVFVLEIRDPITPLLQIGGGP